MSNLTRKKGKIKIALGILLIILVAARIALPFLIVKYVNKTLAKIEGYSGHVNEVDLNLYRGAYVIDSIEIVKNSDSIPVPFILIPHTDLSIHWKALLNGSVVGEVIFEKPEVNFIVKKDTVKQYGEKANWTKALTELIPFTINRFEVVDGVFYFKDHTKSPNVDIAIKQLVLLAENLSNVVNTSAPLPASITASGQSSLGKGMLKIESQANILNQPPDFDINLKFESVHMPDLNKFVRPYIKADFEKGTFNLYTEIYADNGNITGYVKPIMRNMKIINWEEDEGNILKKLWESALEGITEGSENQPIDQFATKVPIKGSLKNTDAGVFPTIWNVFKNAFVEAFEKDLENTVEPEKQ